MKILFLTNTLNYRGTTNAILDYAKYSEEILNHDVVIGYDESIAYEQDMGNEADVISNVKSKFKLVNCNDYNINKVVDDEKIDLIYKLDSGEYIKYDNEVKLAHHAVFQFRNESITAYISKWLSSVMSNNEIPYVPHIVELPKPTKDYRQYFNIPKDAVIIGRHGGYKTFDIQYVKEYISENIDKNNVYYLFMNTEPFVNHKKVIYINRTNDKQKISNFINTCDAMLHARIRGESFGLAIAEFLYHNKPVIACYNGVDKNHHTLTDYLYLDKLMLHDMINNVKSFKGDYKSSIKNFTPKRVMKSFQKHFLEN